MDPYLAQVIIFAGNFAPRSWMLCNGQLVSIAEYTALFSLIGTTYGGDGQQTFALPNLQGRVPVGAGSAPGRSFYDLGQVGGSEQVTILASQIPSHTHTLNIPTTDGPGSTEDPTGNILALQNASVFAAASAQSGSYGGVRFNAAGGNAPVPISSPYLALNYIICSEGIFPSRN